MILLSRQLLLIPGSVPCRLTTMSSKGQPIGQPGFVNWQSGLCGCFSDWNTCCYGCWCPCCLFGENVHKLKGTGCCINCCLYCVLMSCAFASLPLGTTCSGCQCLAGGPARTSMRYKYGGLREEPCSDCVVHWCCSSCANCQGKSADDILLLGHHYALTFQLVLPAEAREIKHHEPISRAAMQFVAQAPGQQIMPAQNSWHHLHLDIFNSMARDTRHQLT
eukprot:jgi/Astpho2/2662/fgenesh1_pg.00049_%23_25_t